MSLGYRGPTPGMTSPNFGGNGLAPPTHITGVTAGPARWNDPGEWGYGQPSQPQQPAMRPPGYAAPPSNGMMFHGNTNAGVPNQGGMSTGTPYGGGSSIINPNVLRGAQMATPQMGGAPQPSTTPPTAGQTRPMSGFAPGASYGNSAAAQRVSQAAGAMNPMSIRQSQPTAQTYSSPMGAQPQAAINPNVLRQVQQQGSPASGMTRTVSSPNSPTTGGGNTAQTFSSPVAAQGAGAAASGLPVTPGSPWTGGAWAQSNNAPAQRSTNPVAMQNSADTYNRQMALLGSQGAFAAMPSGMYGAGGMPTAPGFVGPMGYR